MLVWLANSPTSKEMLSLLAIESFRERVHAFIERNLKAYTPGLESAETIK